MRPSPSTDKEDMGKEAEGESAGYQEQVLGGTDPKTATGQIALEKSRQETYGGLFAEQNGYLKAERLYSASLVQQLSDERAAHQKTFTDLSKMLTEELQRRRDQVQDEIVKRREEAQASLKAIDEAVSLSMTNIERAKLTAHVLNTPPPPRTTAAEDLKEFGMHVVTKLADGLTVVFAGDPAAQERIKSLGIKLLSFAEPEKPAPGAAPPQPAAVGTAAPAGAVGAAPVPPAPAAAGSPRSPSAAELLGIARRLATVTQERVQKYCLEKNLTPDQLSVPEALKLADEQEAAEAAAKQAAEKAAKNAG